MALRGPPEERTPAQLREFGVVNLDKPPGPSAHQVAAWLRDMADVDRAAHAGTLDPKVTGCLPILLGTATRMAQVFDDSVKEYVAVLECHGPVPADFEEITSRFEGEIYQKPPRKSAVARRMRVREIHDLEVLETDSRRGLVRVRCESGTYVRKLCHDIGLAAGVGAHMGHLRRTATEPFDDTTMVTLRDVADALAWSDQGESRVLQGTIRPAEEVLAPLPSLTIAESAALEVADGAPVYAPGVIDAADVPEDELVVCYTPEDEAVCLGYLVGDPDADEGLAVELERVLI